MKIKNSYRLAFTLLELLVTVAIIAILATLLLPGLVHVKERAKRVVCGNNLYQIGLVSHMYAHDNENFLPPMSERVGRMLVRGFNPWDLPRGIYSNMLNYGFHPELFRCPSFRSPNFELTDEQMMTGWKDWIISGYAFATMDAPRVIATNVFEKAAQKVFYRPNRGTYVVGPSEAIMSADHTMSQGQNTKDLSQNNWVHDVTGVRGTKSPHNDGKIATGGNGLYIDGHVAWKNINRMTVRTDGQLSHWW